ncbi:amino acid ABC transporter substrate-binding protein [Pseudoflavonifractor sp. 524-17]|uniref:transporter substrate-binding domain-containing protein n=1 Tax=Pseudoflavonifractor sp. 524-17 TaxID=2304577 RepID=UPI00137B821D|nr:transporter substrate-binding domain-containing protein [Pseudoflavonifractor sp. 524-17]NCE65698.1 amino acid ABC transporter substrate-binding protein [Pseudoflavonifractor sp. 524-17]
MKQKLLSLALAAALGLSMAACSSGQAQTPGNSTPSAPNSDPTASPEAVDNSDLAYVQGQGKLKIGYTVFAPMNYTDDNGEFIGFETEFAKAVCEKLGVEPEFVEINWDAKVVELESGSIDCIWNGMTITKELEESLSISNPYVKNYQVVVIRAADADRYTSTADLAGANLDAEAGSAGEAAIAGDENLSQGNYVAVAKQTDGLLEVKSGVADACVLDFVLAGALVGQADYADLMVIPNLELSVEEYGVGFRKGSDIVPAFNQAMQELIDDGTLNEIAVRYELDDLLLANQ